MRREPPRGGLIARGAGLLKKRFSPELKEWLWLVFGNHQKIIFCVATR